MYGTEEEVGRAIQESGVPREKLFITNKVAQGIDDIHAAIQKSLEKLQSHYFDLSNSRDDPIAEELTSSQLSYSYMYSVLCQVGCRLPACMEVNGTSQRGWEIQIDRLSSNNYLSWLRENGLQSGSFKDLTPASRAPDGPLREPLARIAKKHGTTEAAVLINWTIQNKVLAVTITTKPERLDEYA
ncbi:NADP-dependent oxidoreductase domain-containing protein [Trichoderma sp. TUCIM 5745]